MFDRFTDRARRILVGAQDEARALNHEYVGTEHILLALVAEDGGIANGALRVLGIASETVQEEIRSTVERGTCTPPVRLPFTPNAKRRVEYAMRWALQLNHPYIGTEYILLALATREPDVNTKVHNTKVSTLTSV